MDNLNFSEEEIEEQLGLLGYKNIPKHRLFEFKQDLDELIRRRGWRNQTPPSQTNITSQTIATQPSPPAYIKEKVSCSEVFLLNAGKDHQDVGFYQRKAGGWQQGQSDSYAQHSVAQRQQLHPGTPSRLQVEHDPDRTLNLPTANSHASSPEPQERRLIKRKVLRKHEGQWQVCDESVHSEDSDGANCCLEERLVDLHLSPSAQQDVEEVEQEQDQNDSHSSHTERSSLCAFQSYLTPTLTHEDLRPKPKSFIRPTMSQQSIKKSDPVARYFQYKQIWDMFKCPGETDRRALRWEIKERLAYQPPPPKPQKVFAPNTYTVPTEKKRSALRWEVRHNLANGLHPYKLS